MNSIYRVPLRRVFNKKHSPGDPSWDQIYGKVRCSQCQERFDEGEPYRVISSWIKTRDWTGYPVHKYEHVDCQVQP